MHLPCSALGKLIPDGEGAEMERNARLVFHRLRFRFRLRRLLRNERTRDEARRNLISSKTKAAALIFRVLLAAQDS